MQNQEIWDRIIKKNSSLVLINLYLQNDPTQSDENGKSPVYGMIQASLSSGSWMRASKTYQVTDGSAWRTASSKSSLLDKLSQKHLPETPLDIITPDAPKISFREFMDVSLEFGAYLQRNSIILHYTFENLNREFKNNYQTNNVLNFSQGSRNRH